LRNQLSQAQCHIDDWTALKALYESTNGENWTDRTGWDVLIDNKNSPPTGCDLNLLYGVSLDGNGRVECLDLDGNPGCSWVNSEGNNLVGNISPQIGNISRLKHLHLSNNQLSGNIPSEISNISHLNSLLLFKNELSGNIPPELGNLSHLLHLELDLNDLSGGIPAELGKLSKLSELWLSTNQLTGNIPNELGNLNNLTKLYLNTNHLSGNIPPELGNLSKLTILYLFENNLNGSIPSELGNLNNLTELDIELNELSGRIPVELGNLGNLSTMWLSANELTGSIPVELSNLNNLTVLHLNNNYLNGSIPPELGKLSNLTGLFLYVNELTGKIPSELGSLNSLTDLHLYHNDLTGNIPSELGNLNSLTDLLLYHNSISGSIPSKLGKLNNLTELALDYNGLSGGIPAELGNLSNLSTLWLEHNDLNGSLPAELGDLSNLTLLSVKNNKLSGCYSNNLAVLCIQLTHPSSISDYNNFDATWEDFCTTGAEACPPTIPSQVPTNYSGIVSVDVTLNNADQYILKNDVAVVYDYSTCQNYTNLANCDPVAGFDNLSANEALWVATKAAEYFSTYYDIKIPPINILVNYEEQPNISKYNIANNVIILGKGDGNERGSMAAPDIIAHEYTHAIIDSLSPLGTFGIPGALNESYGDIFGELIEYHCKKQNDWVFGSQVMKDVVGNKEGIRSLSNPKDEHMKYQLPDTYLGEHWIHMDNGCNIDNCGTHTNNGVHNYWFYLLANGGWGTNDNGYSFNIKGMGKDKAANIAFKNLVENLNPGSTYQDAMLGSIKVAHNEYRKNSIEVNTVIEVWRAVGINNYNLNPIKWQIINSELNGTPTVTNEGTIKPYAFDLAIDSLGLDMSADKLSFTLHLPHTHRDLELKEIYLPLSIDDINTSIQNGTMEISINRSNLNATEKGKRIAIKSGSPILGFTICIVSEVADGECSEDKPLAISGFTETKGNHLAFKPAPLLVGSDCSNDPTGEPFTLGVNIALSHRNCSTLGAIAVEVNNNISQGVPPFYFKLYNNEGLFMNSSTHQNLYQFFNLEEDEYLLEVTDSDIGTFTQKISIEFIAEMDGSNCCPKDIMLPVGAVNGSFNATNTISINNGTTMVVGNLEFCKQY